MEGIESSIVGDLGQTDNTPASADDQDASARRKRLRKQDGIKRACNECRQQKLRCDVVQDPFSSCSRCRRLDLTCKIDATFQRVEKRRRKSMQQQLENRQVYSDSSPPHGSPQSDKFVRPGNPLASTPQHHHSINSDGLPTITTHPEDPSRSQNSTRTLPTQPIIPQPSGSRTHSAVSLEASPRYSQDPDIAEITSPRILDGVELTPAEVRDLFAEYFQNYNKFLPFLDRSKSPDFYYGASRLLFWAVIAVASRRYNADLTLITSLSVSVPRLLWSTLQSVPQNFHDVKALCILCTWPFPLSSSSSDPTFMLSGTMMHLAMQMGLHRPRQAQDFSKSIVNIPAEELYDRAITWSACKIVVQSVATGYGQPSLSFDTMYEPPSSNLVEQSPQELRVRLRIETFCGRISKSLYFMSESPETGYRVQQTSIVKLLEDELAQIERDTISSDSSPTLTLYLRCARLHLRLYALFDSPSSENFIQSLLSLYDACQNLLSLVLDLAQDLLSHCPNYVFQMTLSSGFALLKLISSPIMEHLEGTSAKATFNSAIVAVRRMSVSNNDLPGRLADVLAQLKARGLSSSNNADRWQALSLKVRGRMSMSVTFDSLWHWRKGFEVQQAATVAAPVSASTSNGASTLAASPSNLPNRMESQQDFNFDDILFDDFYPLNWMTENTGDFPNILTT